MVRLKKTILLTGANGFIGTQIARYLLKEEQATILALVRAKDTQSANRKLAREWYDWPELTNALGTKIQAISGDICLPHLGLEEADYGHIAGKITHIIHTAADWRLVSIEELRKTNVAGTANVIELAKEANKHHLERFSHISTAYVAGARKGTVTEEDLTDQYGFFTDYEKSKYEAEKIVQADKEDLSVSIFRPSMVVGDSQTGAIKTFNTFYFPLRLYLTGRMQFLPVSPSLKVNVVPVNYVAKSIIQLTFDAKANGLTFHLVAPYESLPTLGELVRFLRTWAKNQLEVKLPRPIFLNVPRSSMKSLLKLQRAFQKRDQRVADTLISLAPYFSENRHFERQNLDTLLGSYDMKWKEILPHLLDYAVYNSFFHRSDRTVHEQVLFRLESKSNPLVYYDIADGKVIRKTAAEMRQDILAATAALRVFGIGLGDRVALTGLNSSRYFAVDIAIGLIGAVSVPIYYTSPPDDINQILQASDSKLFLIGMPSLLSRANELKEDIPLVSICRDNRSIDMSKNIISWEQFLAKGSGSSPYVNAPINFSDTATLRYSSGTTGKPKGAIFRHDNLRYMAESMVSLTPWCARSRRFSYLSFLPMGHVVEGILATYSPYYAPAPVNIFFLEDFRKLQEALPKVKPTIFFSVPRVYEKIWEALGKNSFGRFYLKSKNGMLKKLLRRTVRSMTLKRSGLNNCSQLIVGSASCAEDLLQNYRELGIEIHNAYGMTEAPLVTINRLGRNRLGTVGEPMPMTQLKVAEDGEIMVKGPQVTAGYFDKSLEPPFRDGWLMTGDVGKLTDERSLVIFGRKKELIKTSYGKCIYSGKIENLMREIPAVSEAILVGESKPYCSALLWVDKQLWNEKSFETIDQAVEEMNKNLSNPEKVKKWAILVNNLSIENGDLTANLKIKRNVVSERYSRVIDSLYSGFVPDGEVHVGEAAKDSDN